MIDGIIQLEGKNVNDFLGKFNYEKFDRAIVTTINDDKYDSKNKFVFEYGKNNGYYVNQKNIETYFTPFDVPENTKKLYFSMKYKEDITLGKIRIRVVQIKEKLSTFMNTRSIELFNDYIVGDDSFYIYDSFDYETKTKQLEIDVSKETKQVFLIIEPVWEWTLSFDKAWPIDSQDVWFKYNNLFYQKPGSILFRDADYNYYLYKEKYSKKKLTYFISDTVPELPSTLDNYDFSNVWLCSRDIYDENNNILYKNNTLYALKTTVYTDNTYSIVGFDEIQITKEQIDNGYEAYFLADYQFVKNIKSEHDILGRFIGNLEFGDITFSTLNYVWSPSEDESDVKNNFKYNKDGMYITNNEQGYSREISASKDISTNMKTNKVVWKMTPDGNWSQMTETEKLVIGNYNITVEDDVLKFNKVGR